MRIDTDYGWVSNEYGSDQWISNSHPTFHSSSGESDQDRRRVLYVSITLAGFDARILVLGIGLPPLLYCYL